MFHGAAIGQTHLGMPLLRKSHVLTQPCEHRVFTDACDDEYRVKQGRYRLRRMTGSEEVPPDFKELLR